MTLFTGVPAPRLSLGPRARWRDQRSGESDVVRLSIADDQHGLDLAAVIELERRLSPMPGAPRHVILDLHTAVGPDTATLALLCTLLRRCTTAGVRITVADAQRRVRRVLEVCRIDGLALDPHRPTDR